MVIIFELITLPNIRFNNLLAQVNTLVPFGCTGNDEVTLRDSTDGGATFTDKISLSNSIGADSQDVEIAADGNNVIIAW